MHNHLNTLFWKTHVRYCIHFYVFSKFTLRYFSFNYSVWVSLEFSRSFLSEFALQRARELMNMFSWDILEIFIFHSVCTDGRLTEAVSFIVQFAAFSCWCSTIANLVTWIWVILQHKKDVQNQDIQKKTRCTSVACPYSEKYK